MHRLNCLFRALFLIAILLAASPARATTIDAAGAAHLKTLFSSMIGDQSKQSGQQGGRLVTDGAILVEAADGYYAVTLPHLTSFAADGSRVDIGMVAINAIPDDKPDLWKMSVALPTPITWYDSSGVKKFSVDVGKQNFAGIWHEKLGSFVKLKAEYRDIRILAGDQSFHAGLESLTILYDLAENKNGTWSGPMDFAANGLSLSSSDKSTVTFAKLEAISRVEGYTPDAVAAYRKKQEAAGKSGGDPRLQSYDMFAFMLGRAWESLSFKGTIDNFVAANPAANGRPVGRLKLDHGAFSVGLSGFRQNKLDLQLGLAYDGMALTPPPGGFGAAAPDKINTVVRIDGLPYDALAAFGRQIVLAQTMQTPEAAQMTRMKALAGLPPVAQTAGAKISLQNLNFGNGLYNVMTTGTLTADPKAAHGATGKGRVEISGLDRLGDAVKIQMDDAHTPDEAKPALLKLASTLTLLQVIGQQGTSAQGQPVRSYDLELAPQGQILLNGADINTLFPVAAALEAAPSKTGK